MKAVLRPKVLGALAGTAALAAAINANAVPSFARQTGLACMACHTIYPELTDFGRTFKLNGYTLTGMKQIEMPAGTDSGGVKINEIPPLSAMLQLSWTHMSNNNAAGGQNNNVEFPQQLSLFYAGEISPHMGAFMQFTYAQDASGFSMDNTDIRYANHTTVAGAPLSYGIDLNNNPTVEDLWNSTPAWGFPFAGSDTGATGFGAGGNSMIANLGQMVAGLGGYAMWNNHLYGDVTLYRSAEVGGPTPPDGSVGAIKNVAPYWRLAYQTNFGPNYLMVGTYGMEGKFYTQGSLSGPTDNYTDVAIDTQYQRALGNDAIGVYASVLRENEDLKASNGPNTPTTHLTAINVAGTYHWGNEAEAMASYFDNNGSASAGNAITDGEILQFNYLPWMNTKFGIQYTLYNKVNGTSNNASDNNTLYLLGWLMF